MADPVNDDLVGRLEAAVSRLLPVVVTETPDYAEMTFGEARAQAMTLEPDTFLALNELPALIERLRKPKEPEVVAWREMDSAPRDGRLILLAFGSDHTSTGAYHRNDDDLHPWKFIDTQGPGLPIFNGARDDKYGPTGWMEHPKWSAALRPSAGTGSNKGEG